MGAPLFVEIGWDAESLESVLNFVVRDCTLKSTTQSLQILKDNCYSETVNAALISESHTAKGNVWKLNLFIFFFQVKSGYLFVLEKKNGIQNWF